MQKIIHVAIAGCAVGLPGTRVRTVGIGSCVVVALYDPKARVGGMFHAMLPSRKGSSHKSKEKEVASNGLDPKYVDEALGQLILEIEKKGGRVRNLKATIIGGASIFFPFLYLEKGSDPYFPAGFGKGVRPLSPRRDHHRNRGLTPFPISPKQPFY